MSNLRGKIATQAIRTLIEIAEATSWNEALGGLEDGIDEAEAATIAWELLESTTEAHNE